MEGGPCFDLVGKHDYNLLLYMKKKNYPFRNTHAGYLLVTPLNPGSVMNASAPGVRAAMAIRPRR